ncbi:RHS repeat domain-containing protein [Pirellulaceae bacterium SH467]
MSNYGFTSAGTSYDDEDRLTGFARASGTFTQSWSLTSVGDWNSITTNGTAQNRTHFLTYSRHPYTDCTCPDCSTSSSSLSPPASGLLPDFDNKLKSADVDNNGSNDVTFQYDALGRRVARQGTSGSFVYVQHDQQTIADYGYGDAPSSPTHRYVYASYIDEPVVRKAAGTSGTIHYYHRNQQYSITAVTTSSGSVAERYAYTAYGQPTILDGSGSVLASSAINNRYTYTGREWDQTLGLYHFRARWMSGLAGRFMGRDPIGYRGGRSLYRCYFSIRGELDPSGLRAVVGIGANGPIYKHEPGDSSPQPPYGDACFTLSQYGPIWEPCPREPPDWPKGPSYRDGLTQLLDGLGLLRATCRKCCKKPSGCDSNQCEIESRQLTEALMHSWDEYYNAGPASDYSEAVGGYFCYEWAVIFQNALNSTNSKCFSGIRTGCRHNGGPVINPGGVEIDRTHEWLEVTIGEASSGCKVAIDDGFLNSAPGFVHPSPFPPLDEPNYTIPFPEHDWNLDTPLPKPKPKPRRIR